MYHHFQQGIKRLTSQVTSGEQRPFQFRDPTSNSHYWSSHISLVFSSENWGLHQDNIRSKDWTTCQLENAFIFWGKIRCSWLFAVNKFNTINSFWLGVYQIGVKKDKHNVVSMETTAYVISKRLTLCVSRDNIAIYDTNKANSAKTVG